MKRAILCFFVLIFGGQNALAQSRGGSSTSQFYFEETFFPVYVSNNDVNVGGGSVTGNAPTESGLGFDTKTTFGYIWNDILFGLSYGYYSLSTSRPRSAPYEGETKTVKKTEFGPTLGYFLGNWRFAFTYYFGASKTVDDKFTDATTGATSLDESYENTDGSGFQFAIGYDFVLGAGFGISPTLVYRTVKYSKQAYTVRTGSGTPYTATAMTAKAIDDTLQPMITLNYRF